MKYKAFTAALLSAAFITTASGCSSGNWIDKYDKYMDYSMEYWQVTDTNEFKEDGKAYTEWTITFKDAYAEDVTYILSNQTSVADDIAFGSSVAKIACNLTERELRPMLNLSESELGLRTGADFCGDAYAFDFAYLQTDEKKCNQYVKSLISAKDGIKLSEVTARSFLSKQPRMAFLYFITTSEDEAEREQYQQRINGIVDSVRQQIGEDANILAVLNFEKDDETREAISYRAFLDGSEISLENESDLTPAQQYNEMLKSSYHLN